MYMYMCMYVYIYRYLFGGPEIRILVFWALYLGSSIGELPYMYMYRYLYVSSAHKIVDNTEHIEQQQ